MRPLADRLRRPSAWAELFAIGNLGFLAVDILVAHATNRFEKPAEWIPFVFSLAAAPLLLVAFLGGDRLFARRLALTVGAIAILVGVAGLLLHLDSHFFREQTLKNLVYTAPFAAPLAYTGLGLLVLLNRMVDAESSEWAVWILVLALGGFIGNFVLSLADHAQNAFFRPIEWTAAGAAAFAVGFLGVAAFVDRRAPFLRACAVLMGLEVLVGILGFYLHLRGSLGGTASLKERLIYGAPLFAPLLFANLAVLAAIGLYALGRHSAAAGAPARLVN